MRCGRPVARAPGGAKTRTAAPGGRAQAWQPAASALREAETRARDPGAGRPEDPEAGVSDTDSFIDEVNEELKRDRLFAFMRKYAWVAVVVVVALVGGTSFNEWRKAQARAEAEAFGDQVVAALDNTDLAARGAALEAIHPEGARQGILNLLIAASDLAQQDRPGTLAALASVENDSTLPLSYRQIAALKRVIVGGADIPADERQSVLQGLAAPGGTFRPLALEQLALLAMEQGDRDGALRQAQALLQEPELTDALNRRVRQLIVVLGGDLPTDLG